MGQNGNSRRYSEENALKNAPELTVYPARAHQNFENSVNAITISENEDACSHCDGTNSANCKQNMRHRRFLCLSACNVQVHAVCVATFYHIFILVRLDRMPVRLRSCNSSFEADKSKLKLKKCQSLCVDLYGCRVSSVREKKYV